MEIIFVNFKSKSVGTGVLTLRLVALREGIICVHRWSIALAFAFFLFEHLELAHILAKRSLTYRLLSLLLFSFMYGQLSLLSRAFELLEGIVREALLILEL